MKMKEDSEKERLEQLEQEEIEKSKRLSRRSSSPGVRHSQPDAAERSAHSEPIPRITQFVSSSLKISPIKSRIFLMIPHSNKLLNLLSLIFNLKLSCLSSLLH